MITQEQFLGGAVTSELSSDLTLKRGSKRLQIVYPTGAPRDVPLPDARKLRTGGPHFYVYNLGTENAILKDAGGGTVATLAPASCVALGLLDNTTLAGDWTHYTSTLLGYAGLISDAFDDTDGLTGPFNGGLMLNEAIAAASGQLTFSGTQPSTSIHSWAHSGRPGGAFLLPNKSFVIETAVTALDNTNVLPRGGIGIYDRTAAAGLPEWFITARSVIMTYAKKGVINRVSWEAVGKVSAFADVAYTPTVVKPVYLRIEYDHATTTILFKYKGDDESSWTTVGTTNIGADYWTAFMDAHMMIDSPGSGGTGDFSVDFNYMKIWVL